MGGKKTTTTTNQQQTATYGQVQPQANEYTDRLKNWQPDNSLLEENIRTSFGSARRNIVNGYNSPYSGIPSAVARNMGRDEGLADLAERESAAMRSANDNRNQQVFQRDAYLAGLMGPKIVQTGGTVNGTNVTKENPGLFGWLGAGLQAAGTAAMFSDERLKKVGGEVPEGEEAINALRPRQYEYTPEAQDTLGVPAGPREGLVAQETASALPQAVKPDPATGALQVDYENVIAALIRAFQQQSQDINELKQAAGVV